MLSPLVLFFPAAPPNFADRRLNNRNLFFYVPFVCEPMICIKPPGQAKNAAISISLQTWEEAGIAIPPTPGRQQVIRRITRQ
jgi:hypothetical protein